MNPKLKAKTIEALSAVLPITGIVLALSIFLAPVETGAMALFLTGAVMLVVGMGLFQLGAEVSMSPLGEGVGIAMSKSKKLLTVTAAAFLMGVIITVAEPDLQVLAEQIPSVPNAALIATVAVGVGVFLVVAVLRIYLKIRLATLLLIVYVVLIGASFLAPESFFAVAFDSGGVTTGPITVPFIMTMGVGLAAVRGDKYAADDSFGLVALASGGPILAVLLLGALFNPGEGAYHAAEAAQVVTMRDVARCFAVEIPKYAWDVMISIVPIVLVFVAFQLISRRFHRKQRRRILMGFVYTYAGLVLFLCGVNVGFAPVGRILGREMAGAAHNWTLVPVGMLIGYFIVKAEPSIQVLNRQVHTVTNGTISEKSMNLCLSIGVSVSVGLAMLRVLTGIPFRWIIIPGYAVALLLSRFVPNIFVGIAFDSGGVASGPMTTTFLLPLSIGACEVLGGNVMTDAFGVVALVALTPLIAVQSMGLRYKSRMKRLEKQARTQAPITSDEIIELEEDLGQ